MRAVYPGSFDPLTIAHLAVAEAVRVQCGATAVDFAISRRALAKDAAAQAAIDDRVAAIQHAAVTRPWLQVIVTDRQLIADIAAGYDIVVVGADKWSQVLDAGFYRSQDACYEAVARLPMVALAPRPPTPLARPPEGVVTQLLDLPAHLGEVSSSGVRSGRQDWSVSEG